MVIPKAAERQLGREAVLAMRSVAEAIDLARAVERDAATGALEKGDTSPVTIADFSVQALVAARLGRDCPSDPLIAEEDATALRTAPGVSARVVDFVTRADSSLVPDRVLDWIDRGGGIPGRRFWTLDPIDGTKGLLRGGQYAVALALIADGIVQIGVLGCPRLSLGDLVTNSQLQVGGKGGMAVAVRGRGAWWSSCADETLQRLVVSKVSDSRQARLLHSFEPSHNDVEALRRVADLLRIEPRPCLMDSQAKHVVIASGAADVLLRFPTGGLSYREAIWDEASGSLLIEEAGGRVTDLVGRALDFSAGRRLSRNVGLVATNGVLHDSVLKVIQDAQAKPLEDRTF